MHISRDQVVASRDFGYLKSKQKQHPTQRSAKTQTTGVLKCEGEERIIGCVVRLITKNIGFNLIFCEQWTGMEWGVGFRWQ